MKFNTLNYTEIRSCPKREWDIVAQKTACSHEELRFKRRIPIISDLLELPLARKSKLTKPEMIAIVLYTGPMV